MQVFKIGEELARQYDGAGHALAAVTGGRVVALRYLRDALPDYGEGEGVARLAVAIDDARLGPAVRELQALGEVCVGMCSCWEFVVL
jgi:hypothetical protein